MQMTGKRRWWASGLVVAWAVVLVLAAIWSAHVDSPTVRGQTDLADGRQTLDEAVGAVAQAAGPEAQVEIQPYQLTPDCRVTLARSGTELDQTLIITVPVGEEPALFTRLVEELPDEWDARYTPHRNRFFADAGNFVALRGEMTQPGRVELTVGAGCRPGADPALAP